MTPQQLKAVKIIASMEPWWRDIDKPRKVDKRDGRTERQQIFDSAVFAAAELIRRYTKDEHLAGAMHELCFWARIKREKDENL